MSPRPISHRSDGDRTVPEARLTETQSCGKLLGGFRLAPRPVVQASTSCIVTAAASPFPELPAGESWSRCQDGGGWAADEAHRPVWRARGPGSPPGSPAQGRAPSVTHPPQPVPSDPVRITREELRRRGKGITVPGLGPRPGTPGLPATLVQTPRKVDLQGEMSYSKSPKPPICWWDLPRAKKSNK